MERTCDGSDPNLLQFNYVTLGYDPCDCGNTFDDVQRITIFPHELLASQIPDLRLERKTLASPEHRP